MNALPHIRPVIPVKKANPFDDPEWAFDLKYDGYRGVLYSHSTGACTLLSKSGKRLPFPDLERRLAKCLNGAEVVLDGEVCSFDEENRPVFSDLQARKGNIAYVAFDILRLEGKDLCEMPLRDRKRILGVFAQKKLECMRVAFSVESHGVDFFEIATKLDLEGIVAKRLDGPYSRRTRWYKILNPRYSQAKARQRLFAARRSL
ncbi:hypothetical protein KW799_01025 [Candidatus Parcubacteria bacterium]|nr:hypothetical protein [Candidatus Parcubacteria bacterium]